LAFVLILDVVKFRYVIGWERCISASCNRLHRHWDNL